MSTPQEPERAQSHGGGSGGGAGGAVPAGDALSPHAPAPGDAPSADELPPTQAMTAVESSAQSDAGSETPSADLPETQESNAAEREDSSAPGADAGPAPAPADSPETADLPETQAMSAADGAAAGAPDTDAAPATDAPSADDLPDTQAMSAAEREGATAPDADEGPTTPPADTGSADDLPDTREMSAAEREDSADDRPGTPAAESSGDALPDTQEMGATEASESDDRGVEGVPGTPAGDSETMVIRAPSVEAQPTTFIPASVFGSPVGHDAGPRREQAPPPPAFRPAGPGPQGAPAQGWNLGSPGSARDRARVEEALREANAGVREPSRAGAPPASGVGSFPAVPPPAAGERFGAPVRGPQTAGELPGHSGRPELAVPPAPSGLAAPPRGSDALQGPPAPGRVIGGPRNVGVFPAGPRPGVGSPVPGASGVRCDRAGLGAPGPVGHPGEQQARNFGPGAPAWSGTAPGGPARASRGQGVAGYAGAGHGGPAHSGPTNSGPPHGGLEQGSSGHGHLGPGGWTGSGASAWDAQYQGYSETAPGTGKPLERMKTEIQLFSLLGFACAFIALFFLPILVGPAGVVLGIVGHVRREERGKWAAVTAGCATIVGLTVGLLFLGSDLVPFVN